MMDREMFRNFLTGQVLCFVGMGVLDFSQAREYVRDLAADDELWKVLPHAHANMCKALPAMTLAMDVDVALADNGAAPGQRAGVS